MVEDVEELAQVAPEEQSWSFRPGLHALGGTKRTRRNRARRQVVGRPEAGRLVHHLAILLGLLSGSEEVLALQSRSVLVAARSGDVVRFTLADCAEECGCLASAGFCGYSLGRLNKIS